jgi:hypothetical protein
VLAVPVWLLSHSGDAGFGPVRFLFSGRAFAERPLVTGGALDQFSLQKELFLFVYSLVLLSPFLALVRWINRAGLRASRGVCAIASLLLLVHPLSILIIYAYDVSRYILHMGLTPLRMLALLFALSGALLLSLLAAWVGGGKARTKPHEFGPHPQTKG